MIEAKEAALESFVFSRALDDHESPIPATLEALGGKGYGLVELTKLGLPVPPGIILTTGAWCEWNAADHSLTEGLKHEISSQLSNLEHTSGKRLGDPDLPLIVSVRSGAPVSMPGAMITLLNVGLNDHTVGALGQEIGEQNAWKTYLEMMIHVGQQAYKIPYDTLNALRIQALARFSVERVSDLPVTELQTLVIRVKQLYHESGFEFPQDPVEQIHLAIHGVYESWDKPEAREYRKQHGIPDSIGTAAIIQQIVWGLGNDKPSGAGVLLTRNIQTGEHAPSIAFVSGKQGTAVVGERGTHRQYAINDLPIPDDAKDELTYIIDVLEQHYPYPQDMEFTYDGKKVWVLQTRDVPLQPAAHFRVLIENIHKGIIPESSAIRQMSVPELQSLLLPPLNPLMVEIKRQTDGVVTRGTPISLGNASGIATHSLEEAAMCPDQHFILVLPSISLPIMTELMNHDKHKNIMGVVTGNGGLGSHIARVGTRVGQHMPIIFGAETTSIAGAELLTVDGGTGEVFRGLIPRVQNGKSKLLTPVEFELVHAWHEARISNPWRYVTNEQGIDAFERQAQEAKDRGITLYQSPKGQVQEVINALLPRDIRIQYAIFKVSEQEEMRTLLKDILTLGNDATVRTCYNPDRQGKAPWVLFTNESQVDQFFDNPVFTSTYGGYQTWIEDPMLTELLVGNIPKNKLSEDPDLLSQHASWTVTCTELGDVIMQVRPHTAQLRGHEEASPDDLITYRFIIDPTDETDIRWTNLSIGEHLKNDLQAEEEAQLVLKHILSWWNTYDIPKRLAAISHVYPSPVYATAVLEGQTRIGKNEWCKIYGLKIDKVEEETPATDD